MQRPHSCCCLYYSPLASLPRPLSLAQASPPSLQDSLLLWHPSVWLLARGLLWWIPQTPDLTLKSPQLHQTHPPRASALPLFPGLLNSLSTLGDPVCLLCDRMISRFGGKGREVSVIFFDMHHQDSQASSWKEVESAAVIATLIWPPCGWRAQASGTEKCELDPC